jgi:hypothetical protein
MAYDYKPPFMYLEELKSQCFKQIKTKTFVLPEIEYVTVSEIQFQNKIVSIPFSIASNWLNRKIYKIKRVLPTHNFTNLVKKLKDLPSSKVYKLIRSPTWALLTMTT